MKKVAISGGTFNPIHLGHIMMAEYILNNDLADEVWFMPNGNPPHKTDDDDIADKAHRANMVKLAIEGNDKFVFCDYEVKKEGYSYLADTLKALNKKFSRCEFYFMLGADSLDSIESWYEFESYAKYCKFFAFGRLGADDIEKTAKHLKDKYSFDITCVDMPSVDISSTDIRNAVKTGDRKVAFLPEKVYNYILDNGLYI